MNLQTGREFSWTNPQDDPHLYPRPPAGFGYGPDGQLIAYPRAPAPTMAYPRPSPLPTTVQQSFFFGGPTAAATSESVAPVQFNWQTPARKDYRPAAPTSIAAALQETAAQNMTSPTSWADQQQQQSAPAEPVTEDLMKEDLDYEQSPLDTQAHLEQVRQEISEICEEDYF